MKNLVTSRNYSIHQSEVLSKKKVVVMINEDFNVFDLLSVFKHVKTKRFTTKVKFHTVEKIS
jgi:hypothetical protein